MRKLCLLLFALLALAPLLGCTSNRALRPPTDAELKSAKSAVASSRDDPTGSMWKESNLPPEKAKKIKKEIEEAFKKDVDIWLRADSPDDFAAAMVGNALAELKKQTEDELSQGKLEIRVHDDRDFEVVRVKEESGIVAYTYVDNSIYVDAKTRKPLGVPWAKSASGS